MKSFYFLIENRKTTFRSIQAGKIKHALAGKLLDLFGKDWSIDPEELTVNRGSNQYNDWCSWTGWMIDPDGYKWQIHSWSTMGELAKRKEPLVIIGNKEMTGTEIS